MFLSNRKVGKISGTDSRLGSAVPFLSVHVDFERFSVLEEGDEGSVCFVLFCFVLFCFVLFFVFCFLFFVFCFLFFVFCFLFFVFCFWLFFHFDLFFSFLSFYFLFSFILPNSTPQTSTINPSMET